MTLATCYRHPGRETNVACSNCERPICPDCMTPTPVGMRCPECARQTTPVRRGVQTGIGGGTAPATYALIAINVAAFIAEMTAGGGSSGFAGSGGKIIRDFGINGPQVAGGDWWRIVTGGFLHAGLLHIAFNMFALYILGGLLEPAIGTRRFLGIYAVSLLAGSAGALILSPNETTVGASGAIFGLMSAAFIVARHRGIEQLAQQIGFYVVLNLVITFGVSGISVGGHIGGLIGGALAALLITYGERRIRSAAIEVLGLAALGAIAVAIALAAA
jgi:membrane associated rhomboid family serine protease